MPNSIHEDVKGQEASNNPHLLTPELCDVSNVVVQGRGLLSARAAGLALTAGLLLSGCATPLRMVEVSPGIFMGRKPYTHADFDALQARGIHTILSVEALPWDVWPERWHAKRNGIQYLDVPIWATPLPPSEKRVKQALELLNENDLRPIYLHCFLGRDRTTFLIGLYRVYFQHWTPEAAWEEMRASGFHVRPTLYGFSTYFWHHTEYTPNWANASPGHGQADRSADLNHPVSCTVLK